MCESLKDGRVLLKVLDRLSPGCVDWRRTRKGPSRPLLKRVHSIETCNRVSIHRSTLYDEHPIGPSVEGSAFSHNHFPKLRVHEACR